jgi:Ca2+-binding EF-hand superfamily protein
MCEVKFTFQSSLKPDHKKKLLDAAEIHEIKEVFDLFDKDQSGAISTKVYFAIGFGCFSNSSSGIWAFHDSSRTWGNFEITYFTPQVTKMEVDEIIAEVDKNHGRVLRKAFHLQMARLFSKSFAILCNLKKN